MSKAMCCVGDKELGELEKDGVYSCTWMDKRLRSMNDVAVSCKLVCILLFDQLFFLLNSQCPSISR